MINIVRYLNGGLFVNFQCSNTICSDQRQPDLFNRNELGRPTVMPVPTPRPNVSQLFEELGNCIRKPQKNEGVHSGTNKGTFK